MSLQYAVFGQPIAHSLSPRIHAMFAAQFGIPLGYRAIEAGRDDFARALDAFAHAGGAGANVTLPLKADALSLCAEASDRARRCGSVNTLTRVGTGWHGESTDGIGLLHDLRIRCGFDLRDCRCLVLGAGGAARAVLFALADAGVEPLVVANRTRERARALVAAVGSANVEAVDWDALGAAGAFDLVLHATAAGHEGAPLALPPSLAADALCYDLSYGDAAGPFLRWARSAGAARVDDGLGMLVQQAAESFRIWHGALPETASVFEALRRERPLAAGA
jgi:shikimate dehydrogenase